MRGGEKVRIKTEFADGCLWAGRQSKVNHVETHFAE